jgi:hypothetical protein
LFSPEATKFGIRAVATSWWIKKTGAYALELFLGLFLLFGARGLVELLNTFRHTEFRNNNEKKKYLAKVNN